MWKHLCALVLTLALLGEQPLHAIINPETVQKETGIQEQLGSQVDLSLRFRDEEGREITLKEAFTPNRPFLLAPVYYTCPNLCNLTLNGVTELLKEIQLKLGTDFSVIAYSIKPEETPDLAAKKRQNYLKELGENFSGDTGKFRFLTGDKETVQKLSQQIGFGYMREGDDFAHAAVLVALTPSGLISKYLFGVMYDAAETRKVLVDASEGRIGTIGERIFLYCFRYDHLTGQYSPVIMNVVRVVSFIVVFLLFGTIIVLRRGEVLSFRREKEKALG